MKKTKFDTMTKQLLFFLSVSLLVGMNSCNDSGDLLNKKRKNPLESAAPPQEDENAETEMVKVPTDFIPEEFAAFDKIFGDLNKDGQEDCVLITKGTDPSAVVEDEYLGKLDRNRRGIIVLFKDGESYEIAIQNDDCFSSENEDGGVYFPPDLSVAVDNGKLYMQYGHGRYGHWKYTFRYQEDDFKLIGFDRANHNGPVLHFSTSYNFLTGKKQTKENVNYYSENPEDEKIEETWEKIEKTELLKLSEIEDFDELSFD